MDSQILLSAPSATDATLTALLTKALQAGWTVTPGSTDANSASYHLAQSFDNAADADTAVAALGLPTADSGSTVTVGEPAQHYSLIGSSEFPAQTTAEAATLTSLTPAAPTRVSQAAPNFVDPLSSLQKDLLGALGEDEKKRIAAAYLDALTAHITAETSAVRSNTAVDPTLIAGIDAAVANPLRISAFSQSAGISSAQTELDQVGVDLAKQRLELAKQVVEGSKQAVVQMKRWTRLSHAAIFFLGVGLLFDIVFTFKAFTLVANNHASGMDLALLIFVLAVAAISPVTLLLLERPLKGIDSFAPTLASTAGDTRSDSTSATSSDTKSASDTTSSSNTNANSNTNSNTNSNSTTTTTTTTNPAAPVTQPATH